MFGFCITHILNTGCAKIWKKKSVAKRLIWSYRLDSLTYWTSLVQCETNKQTNKLNAQWTSQLGRTVQIGMVSYLLGLPDYEVKSGLLFYNFAPSGSSRFTNEGEHHLPNSHTPQKVGTRCLLRFSRFNANLQMLKLVFNKLLYRTRDTISTLYLKYIFSLVSLVLRDICHEKWFVGGKDSVSQITWGFPLCPHLQKSVGHPLAPTREVERVVSLWFSIQIGRLNTTLLWLVSNFRMRDSLFPLFVSYTDSARSFGAGINILPLIGFVDRKVLKEISQITTATQTLLLLRRFAVFAKSSLYRFTLLLYTGTQATQ